MSGAKKIFEFGPDSNGSNAVVFQWSPDSSYIAVASYNRTVYLLDRRGKKIQEAFMPVKSKILMLDWDRECYIVAILVEDSSSVYLWSPLTTNQLEPIEDTPKTKATWLKWSTTHPILAFGTDRGGVIFYNKKNKKKVPTMGKHSKRVITGDWNNEGMLITASEDKIITVSDYTSETKFYSFAVKSEPRNIRWTNPKTDERDTKQRTISTVLNNKSLLLHEVGQTAKQPMEIVMEPKYGKITDYCLYGDGYIVVGFTYGYYAQISTHHKEIKDEVKSYRIFNAPLEAMCTNNTVFKLAVAGYNKVKIISLADWKEAKNEMVELPKNCGKVHKLSWSENGQTLLISTEKGYLYGYVTSVISLTSCYNELISVLNGFTDVTILSTSSKYKGKVICGVSLPTYPQSIHLGPCHVAAKNNSTVKYFQWVRGRSIISGGYEISERDYDSGIKKIMLNDMYAAVLTETGKVILHHIDGKEEKDRKFPIYNDRTILQFSLTKNFLILLDSTNRLKFFHIDDQNFILEHKSDNNIIKIFPNKTGTKVIVQHQNGYVNLMTSATYSLSVVKLVADRVDNVLWDHECSNYFVIINGEKAFSYIVCRNNIFGHVVQSVNEILSVEKVENEEGDPTVTKIEKNVLTLVNGNIYFMSATGTINLIGLASHTFLENYKFYNDSQEGHLRYFFQSLSLKRFSQALIAAKFLNLYAIFYSLGRKALYNLYLDIALKAFQMGQNLSMVLTIQSFIHYNEKNLLIGNIAMVLGKYDIAQEYFLKSSEPLNALDMRCDIQDWFIASSLAKNIAPHQESFICKRLAIQTESQGNNTEALKLYERSVIRDDEKMVYKNVIAAHNVQCFAGMARTSIKLGDIQRGFNIARELRETSLLVDIAVVCYNMKQTLEAAELYEKAGVFEKAAFLFLQLKMFKQAAPLMQKIKSPKLLVQFGKAKESEGSFKEAEAAYEKAESWYDVVRINLMNFDNIYKPKNILRTKCTTTTVASMVANYCEKRGLKKEAVEFLVMAKRKYYAFIIAQTHGEMDTYAACLKDCTDEERTVIAQYYEGKSMWDKAASQYELAKNYMKALKLYQKAGEYYIPQMLEMMSKNKSQYNLIQYLLDYLMGETDEQPKDPIHTYKLYRILGNYKNAAKIAVTIASQEQENGGYKNAHDILFQTYQDIKKANTNIPLELYKKLLILHSYVLVVKRIIKIEEHQDAAFLLNRVAKNLSQFPTNAANILTTVVVEAMRCDMKGLAYNWAVNLVKAEYREQIPKNYKDKIENLARRPIKEENSEPKSPCPFCKYLVSEFQTDCPKCLNNIPFCIASGKHIVGEDLAFCTKCNFPCNYSYMKKLLEHKNAENTCPMCSEAITMDDIKFVGYAGVTSLKVTVAKDNDKEQKPYSKRNISTPAND